MKLIIDTDPGIDDAFALLCALANPKVSVLAITTTYGNIRIDQATQNARQLVRIAQASTPVIPGASEPLSGEFMGCSTDIHGEDGLGNIGLPPLKDQDIHESAHQRIIREIRDAPGEVTVVALGPLTNLALALQQAPDIADKAKQICIMGGAWRHPGNATPHAECNFYQDPEAARLVLEAPWPVALFPLDVTHKLVLDEKLEQHLEQRCGQLGQFLVAISQFGHAYHHRRHLPGMIVHDLAPLVYLLRPYAYQLEHGRAWVITEGAERGQIILQSHNHGPRSNEWLQRPKIALATSINKEAVFGALVDSLS